MGHAARTGIIGLAHKGQHDPLVLGDLPPQSGVQEDRVGLGVAGINHQHWQFLALEALRHVDDILPGVPQPISAVVAEGDHAHLDGAVAVNGHILLGQDLGPVTEGLLHLSGLGLLLGGHPGGGVVQALGDGIGICEGRIIPGVLGHPGVQLCGAHIGTAGHLHLRDAVVGPGGLQTAVGIVGLIGVRIQLLVIGVSLSCGLTVVCRLPVGVAAGIGSQPCRHRRVLRGDLPGNAHLLQGLIQHIGDVAIGALPVIRFAAHAGQIVVSGTLAVHKSLADDKDGSLSGPGLQGSGTLAVARQIKLSKGGEHVDASLISAALQEGNGGVHVGLLLRRAAPALRAGLQYEQAFALLVHQVDPPLVLQELLGIHAIGHRDHGEVGADGRLLGDVHRHLAVTLHIDVLREPAGQRQLGRLGPVLLQRRDGVQIHAAQLIQPHRHTRRVGSAHRALGGQLAVHRLHHTAGQCPGHGLAGPAVQLPGIGVTGQVRRGADHRVLILRRKLGRHHRHLLAGDGLVHTEASVLVARRDPLLHRPGGRLGKPVARLHVGEGVLALHRWLSRHLVQHRHPHGPGDGALRIEGLPAHARHQAVVVGVHHILVVGCAPAHVLELLLRLIRRASRHRHGQRQRRRSGHSHKSLHLSFHLVCFLPKFVHALQNRYLVPPLYRLPFFVVFHNFCCLD